VGHRCPPAVRDVLHSRFPGTVILCQASPVWEVAVEAAVPLITGHLKHFPAEVCTGIKVLTPAAFIERWRSSHS
jgi:hypothetical protein